MLKLSNGWTDWHQSWHACVDSSGNGYTPNKLPFDTQGGHLGVLGGQTFKSLKKLSNGWTNWHQLWFTSADSSGNGHRINTSRPSIPQGYFGGGGLGVTNLSLGKLPNGWPDWHQIRYTSVDSSGNGHRANTIRPSIPQGYFGGVGFRGSQI